MINLKTARLLTRREVEDWTCENEAEEMINQRLIQLLNMGRTILIDDKGVLQMSTNQTKH
jgi:hypothetical protein